MYNIPAFLAAILLIIVVGLIPYYSGKESIIESCKHYNKYQISETKYMTCNIVEVE